MGFLMGERTLHIDGRLEGAIGLDLYQDCWDRSFEVVGRGGDQETPLHSTCAYMVHHLNRMIRNIHLSTSQNPTFNPY
jgi:hypothetical protein